MQQTPSLDLLNTINTSSISDAMDSLGLSGAVVGIQRRATAARVAGRVKTVKLVDSPPEGHADARIGADAVENASGDDVIVVEQRTGVDAAGCGARLAIAAKQKGLRGVIVEGPARDIDEYTAIGLPVFSRSVTTLGAEGRLYEEGTDLPITVGELKVRAGDYVVADASGVVFIAADDVMAVLQRAVEISQLDPEAASLRSGRPIIEVTGAQLQSGRPIIESGRPIIEESDPPDTTVQPTPTSSD